MKYTRFFDFDNFRLPLSTFLVNILRHFRINISQLSVIGPAKVSHFEILCRVYGITPTVGLFRCFYATSIKNGWMSFNMDIFAFIHTPDPTKVKVVERERIKDEPRLLEVTVGRTVPLLSVAPDRAESELEASVDKLFDEGGSGNQAEQGDFAGVKEGANIQPVTEATDTVAEDRLLAGAVLNAEVRGEPIPTLPFVTSSVSATPGHEGEDHTDSVVRPNLRTIGASQRFVISSDSSHHSGTNVAEAQVDSLIRSSAPIMKTVTIVTSTVDTATATKEKSAKPSPFSAESSSAGGAEPNTGIFLDLFWQRLSRWWYPHSDLQKTYVPQWSVTNGSRLDDGRICCEMVDEFAPPKFFASVRGMEHDQLITEFNVGAACQMSLSAEVRMRAEYNVKERWRLKSIVEEKDVLLKARDEEIGNLKAQMLLKEAEAAEAIHLRAEASTFETMEKSLRDEVNALKERNTILEKERNALDVKVTGLEASTMDKEHELTNMNAQLTSVKSQNDNLTNQVHELEVFSARLQERLSSYENLTERLEEFQDAQLKIVNDKFDKLYADFVEMALHLEERFYPHLLTTISGRRWLLTHGMELAITKCLHSPEYLSALGAAIGKAIEKGMQDGLSARITHGTKGPTKDASVDTLMNILRLEETLAERLGLTESQPYVDQLMVPIHHSPDKVIVGATAPSLALHVSSIRVRKIRENIVSQRSALRDVFVPLSEPFSAKVLTSVEGTSDSVPATADTTTALSITLASANTIAPISVDDYEVVGTDNQADADGNAEPFPNVDDAELNIPQ
ncbi:hypothetical protein Tco_0572564 [Tanacetum coccineum]